MSPAAPAPPSTPPATVAAKAAALRRLELDVMRRLDGMLTGDYLARGGRTGKRAVRGSTLRAR